MEIKVLPMYTVVHKTLRIINCIDDVGQWMDSHAV